MQTIRRVVPILLLFLSAIQARPQTLVVSPEPQEAPTTKPADIIEPTVPPQVAQFHVKTDIQFRYAHTVVESYYKNPDVVPQQVTFSLVLPDSAFVSNFSMLIDDNEYVARVEPKEEARDTFTQAVEQGQSAGIVEQDARDANRFAVTANIEAGGKTRFRLVYEELLQRRLQRYEHVLYVNPGQIVDDFRVDVYINESLPVTSVNVPELKTDPNAITSFKSNPDAVVVHDPEDESKVHITYKPSVETQKQLGEETGVSGQLIVQYDVDRKREEGEVQVIDGYFVHFFAPDQLETLPKHVVFVLDVSGSMYGEKLQQTKDAMVTIIDDLTEQDSFNILTFSDDVYHWIPEEEKLKDGEHLLTYPGTRAMRNEALRHVLGLRTIGGTNINQGLLDALTKVAEVQQAEVLPANTKPIIIFLTDGQATTGITDKDTIKSNVIDANDRKVPLYSLAFGQGADFNLVKEISLSNDAFARRIYEGSDAAIQLEDFYLEIASPLLSDLKIEYKGEYVNMSTLTNTKVRSFNKGNEIVVSGKLSNNLIDAAEGDEILDVHISGMDKEGSYQKNLRLCLPVPVPLDDNGRPLPMPKVEDDQPLEVEEDVAVVETEDDVVIETDELPTPISHPTDIIIKPIIPIPIPFPNDCFPLPPQPREPRSDAQNFIERLWAFMTIKDLLDGKKSELEDRKEELQEADDEDSNESDEDSNESDEDEDSNESDEYSTEDEDDDAEKPAATIALIEDEEEELDDIFTEFPEPKVKTNKEKALELALKYNFVTELTSLVVVRPNATDNSTTSDEVVDLKPVDFHTSGLRGPGIAVRAPCHGCFSAIHAVQRVSAPTLMRGPPMNLHFLLGTITTTTTPITTTTTTISSLHSGISASGGAAGFGNRRKMSKPLGRPAPPAFPVPAQQPPVPLYDMDIDQEYDSDYIDAFEEVAPAPKTNCSGSVSLHTSTYTRGENVTLSATSNDTTSVFTDEFSGLTSLEARGDCCWKIYTQPDFLGESKVFSPKVYNSAGDMGVVFRAAGSVERLFEC